MEGPPKGLGLFPYFRGIKQKRSLKQVVVNGKLNNDCRNCLKTITEIFSELIKKLQKFRENLTKFMGKYKNNYKKLQSLGTNI